jgi:hypothetical protein
MASVTVSKGQVRLTVNSSDYPLNSPACSETLSPKQARELSARLLIASVQADGTFEPEPIRERRKGEECL